MSFFAPPPGVGTEMTIDTQSQPPVNDAEVLPSNSVKLSAQKDGKILSVSVYTGRAEVTRLFKFNVQAGQNQVIVSELPISIDQQSFRVEGRGIATIHDVTFIAPTARPMFGGANVANSVTSAKLTELGLAHTRTSQALTRAKKALAFVDTYLGSLKPDDVALSSLSSVVDGYETAAEKLDAKVLELELLQRQQSKDIDEETKSLTRLREKKQFGLTAQIGVSANEEGEVEIALMYAITDTAWSPDYDVRVTMAKKNEPVSLVYKASIRQNSGEDWVGVPITLETVSPSFGVNIPKLFPWRVSIIDNRPPVPPPRPQMSVCGFGAATATQGGLFGGGGFGATPASSGNTNTGGGLFGLNPLEHRERDAAAGLRQQSGGFSGFGAKPSTPDGTAMQHRSLEVSSKNDVNATFSVPGLMTIPGDNTARKVTIAELSLDAAFEWVCVPKHDTKAIIKNASEYTLLRGPSTMHLDGSFIARSTIPAASPDESFDCPLGPDPSIRITYHPLVKKISQTGFLTKSIKYGFSRRITMYNAKAQSVENVIVVDQIPVSEDAAIEVKLVSPALELPAPSAGTASAQSSTWAEKKADSTKAPAPVEVSKGVVAQWGDGVVGADSHGDMGALGKDGKLHWKCSLPPQGKVTLELKWEVSAPVGNDIMGL
ncbi:hypothetical protein D9611_007229 [Ephemerocybe angulata]|uniref:Mucoidy inhibitor A n=1 Tax=Ephemerocybe angulata TaxID=980116 RepID=A0A8H5EW48_9AGAR|nr:hypothetical protein D9611_007229 [Tulosesus angulatus]